MLPNVAQAPGLDGTGVLRGPGGYGYRNLWPGVNHRHLTQYRVNEASFVAGQAGRPLTFQEENLRLPKPILRP